MRDSGGRLLSRCARVARVSSLRRRILTRILCWRWVLALLRVLALRRVHALRRVLTLLRVLALWRVLALRRVLTLLRVLALWRVLALRRVLTLWRIHARLWRIASLGQHEILREPADDREATHRRRISVVRRRRIAQILRIRRRVPEPSHVSWS
jgi:hypothetical protein